MNYATGYYNSPIGQLKLTSNGHKLTRLTLTPTKTAAQPDTLIEHAITQLSEYFSGDRKSFNLPVELPGTAFEQKTWQALQTIPHGHSISYKALALLIEHPKAYRAVGSACGKNPIPIIVPCHRVLASNGSLAGFALGTDIKSRLLKLESA